MYVCSDYRYAQWEGQKLKWYWAEWRKESLKPFFGFLEIKVWDVIVCLKISGEIEAVWWQKPPQITQTSIFLATQQPGSFLNVDTIDYAGA